MLSPGLQQLLKDVDNADPTNDQLFFDLLTRAFILLNLSVDEIAKTFGQEKQVVLQWLDGETTAAMSIRPWLYKYILKQINHSDVVVSYHATDNYGYIYNFYDVKDNYILSQLCMKLAVCGHLLDRVQISYMPPKLRLSFFAENIASHLSKEPLEELHYLISKLDGQSEVHMSGGNNAMIIPLSKKEKEVKDTISLVVRHCYELKDGCHIEVGGRCVCACCLLDKAGQKTPIKELA